MFHFFLFTFLLCFLPVQSAYSVQSSAQASLQGSLSQALNKDLNKYPALKYLLSLKQAGLWVGDNKPLLSMRAQKSFIPASTTKLLTAQMALQHWGGEYRFKTPIYLNVSYDGKATLRVVGKGDPFLTSEVIQIMAKEIAQELRARGVRTLHQLILDDGYFAQTNLPGIGRSNNPYDALPGALVANFNTVKLRYKNGWQSAEEQTPFTSTLADVGNYWFAKSKLNKPQRVNLGKNLHQNTLYFGELLMTFLQGEGIEGDLGQIQVQDANTPKMLWQELMIFENSNTLSDFVPSMLRYSTNFIANQLVLALAAETFRQPATPDLVARLFADYLIKENMTPAAFFEEGAGLSRRNQINAELFADWLRRHSSIASALPMIEKGVLAKSGTLLNVRSLAGFIENNEQKIPFVLLINENVPYKFRDQVAQELRLFLKSQSK